MKKLLRSIHHHHDLHDHDHDHSLAHQHYLGQYHLAGQTNNRQSHDHHKVQSDDQAVGQQTQTDDKNC